MLSVSAVLIYVRLISNRQSWLNVANEIIFLLGGGREGGEQFAPKRYSCFQFLLVPRPDETASTWRSLYARRINLDGIVPLMIQVSAAKWRKWLARARWDRRFTKSSKKSARNCSNVPGYFAAEHAAIDRGLRNEYCYRMWNILLSYRWTRKFGLFGETRKETSYLLREIYFMNRYCSLTHRNCLFNYQIMNILNLYLHCSLINRRM